MTTKRKFPWSDGVKALNEISWNVGLTASKGGAQAAGSSAGNADLAGAEMIASVQTLSTTEAQISIGGCDQIQVIYLYNMDDAISITVGLNNPITQLVSVIPPLKGSILWNPPATLYAKGASGTPNLYAVVIET